MPPETGDAQRALTKHDVEAIVDHLIDRISDQKTVEQITTAWSEVVDRAIGKGVRRLIYAVGLAVLVIGAVKFDLLLKIFKGA